MPLLDAAILRDEDGVTIFAVNRSQDAALPLTVDLRALPQLSRARHTYLGDDDPSAANTAEAPDRVRPRQGADIAVDGGTMLVTLPPLSWNMLRIV